MAAIDGEKAAVIAAHHEMYRLMLSARTDQLSALLDDGYTLTHMTGRVQAKQEWLDAIDSGQMRYHSAVEKSVAVTMDGDHAVLVGKSEVTATIYGGRGTWNLQLTTSYSRRNGKWVADNTVATTF